MQIFNVGIMEVAFVLVIVLLVYNPKEISKNIKTVTKTINSVKRSEIWNDLTNVTKEIMSYPQMLKDQIESDLEDDAVIISDKPSDRNKQVPPKLPQEKQPQEVE